MKNSKPAKAKAPDRERTIALLGDELVFEIPISAFKATKELAARHNYKILYISGEAFQSPFEFHVQANILYDLISPQIADGLITLSNLLSSFTSPRKFRERCLQFRPLPLVSLGLAMEGIPSVVLDNTAGMYAAVHHLLDVHHLTRIAFVNGPQEHPDAIERFGAFTRALEASGLPVDAGLLLQGNYRHDSGKAAVGELLDIRGKIAGRDVQAIVCCNDYMAAGVMMELQARGVRIPEEIALIGFDDIPFTACLTPSLSTIHQPFDTMAARATEMLITMLEGKAVPEVVRVQACFIPRRSCGCANAPHDDHSLPLPERVESELKTNPYKFLEQLNQRIVTSDKPTINVWKKAFTHLGSSDIWNRISAPNDASGNLGKTAWGLLGAIAYNTFHSTGFQNMIHDMGIALTTTLELADLLNILMKTLPGVGIGRCCLCLYENPQNTPGVLPPWSRLILAFNQSGQEELPTGGLRFATMQLLPEEIISKQGWKSWVAIALYYHAEQLGYVLMDSDAPYENIYWSFRKQISGALKGACLLEEIRKANSLLMEANEQKTQFFINVAHETKTPLTVIKNFLALYMQQHPADEQLLVISQNFDILLENMLNFLDVEKLQKGNTLYRHESLVDLSESARIKCTLFRGAAQLKKIRITVNIEDGVLIRIDPLALDRILNNLLDNAVKYIQTGGRIVLDVRSRAGKSILRVSDNGPGLPADTYKHIFEPYYLLSKNKTSKQGIGVGLSIVKKIVDGMGAAITVGRCRGSGACFTIFFEDSSAERKGEAPRVIPTTPSLPTVSVNVKERNIKPEKRSLFIIDDNIHLLKFMQSSLEKTYNVFLARDVAEARFKLKTIPRPDLIIADIMMDGPDGFTLLSELAAMDVYNDIPLIFLTALGGEKQRIRGLGLGAVDYIEKPFSLAELTAKIDSIVALRKRQEKQDIVHIKNRIDGLFSGIGENITGSTKQGFDSFCEKYGVNGREPEIIRLLLKGLVQKEIAAKLNISLRSVGYQLSKIFKKCGVSNKYDLFTKIQG